MLLANTLLIGLVLAAAGDPAAAQTRGPKKVPEGAAIVLRGAVLTPEGVIKRGDVAILNGRIASVSEVRAAALESRPALHQPQPVAGRCGAPPSRRRPIQPLGSLTLL